jgi:iron complex outermembrane receptor protein
MPLTLVTLLLFAGLAAPAAALGPGPQPDAEAEQRDLTRLSIEELANIRVETVSRRPESRIEAAGAVHVITEEDIRRSGITALPDAVRLSPGVQSSRIDADEWALSVRGFASRLSRSVLVTLDGRSLWTPLFAGVFWDQHDASLFDLDRIEVSRGPYGALFGANAMNGVISIVTKSADRTHGGLASVGVGTAEQIATLRYGGEARPGLHYRAWGQYRRRDGTTALAGDAYDDAWTIFTGGFRSDWMRGDDTFTLRGGVTDGEAGTRVTVASFTAPFSRTLDGEADFRGGHLLARWQHGLGEGDHVAVHAYYDRTRRAEPHYTEVRDTVDVDAQHRVAWGGRHDFVWGLSARRSHGDFRGRFETLVMEPAHRADDIASVFAQDEVRVGRLRLAAGAKAEWNDYSGWHVQPSVRAGVLLAGAHHLWAAAARGVRTSSRVERDILLYSSLDAAQPLFARLSGSDAFRSESVVSYEAGYKARLGARVYFDVSGFHGVYDDLATNEVGAPVVETGAPPAPARVVIPVVLGNGQEGTSSGVEASATAVVRPGWRVQAAHSFLRVNQRPRPGTTDMSEGFERNSPRHQFWAASYFTAGENKDVDLTLRRIGAIPGHRVEAHTELDARVAWRPRAGLELALVGQNLLRPRHPEFGGGFAIDRAVRARASLEW